MPHITGAEQKRRKHENKTRKKSGRPFQEIEEEKWYNGALMRMRKEKRGGKRATKSRKAFENQISDTIQATDYFFFVNKSLS